MKSISLLHFFALPAVFLSGCITLPESSPTALPVDLPSTSESLEKNVADHWEQVLLESELREMVESLWAGNPELARLAARIDQAAADARIAGAGRLPQGSIAAEGVRQRSQAGDFGTVRESRYSLLASAAWEIDLWGRLSDARYAAVLSAEAASEEYSAARLSLAGVAAGIWYDFRESSLQVELATETLANVRISERTVERRFDAGLAEAVDLHLARANSASAAAAVILRQRQRDGFARALETLLARYPDASFTAPSDLPEPPPPPPAGLPADFLQRRPDIRAALARLEATDFNAAAAAKARLPSLRLTASGGTSSSELSELLSSDRLIATLAGGLTAPVFNAGRLRNEQERAEALAAQQVQLYIETALTALREVETALAAGELFRREEAEIETAVREAGRAEILAADRYARGLVGISVVLESQRRAFDVRSQFLSLRMARLKNHVDTIIALGGDPTLYPLPPSPSQ